MFTLHTFESSARILVREGQNFAGGGQQNYGNLKRDLRKNLQTFRSFAAWAGVFDKNNIIETCWVARRELGDVQDKIGRDGELASFQLLQAGVYCFGLAVNKQDAEGALSVGRGGIGREISGSGANVGF